MSVMEKARNEGDYDTAELQNEGVLQKCTNILEDEVNNVGESCSVEERWIRREEVLVIAEELITEKSVV